jgi:uncharacterized protein (TIGR02246 family)
MRRILFGGLALLATSAFAAEVTVIRPSAFVGQEWAYYILIGDQKTPVADLRSGERVTLQVPADTRTLVIQCPKGLGAHYDESRIDYDFKGNDRAFFLLSAKPSCVTIESVDARTASTWINRTRSRPTGRALEYDPPASPQQQLVRATPSSVPALTTTDSAAKDQILAATAAWVEAFNSRDPARLAALYDAEAVLTDAAEPRPRIGAAAIAEYYKKAAQRPTQRVALGERNLRLLGDDTAIDSGTLTYFEMRDGNATTTPGRYSLTYQKRGGKWLIVDHQSSPAPR